MKKSGRDEASILTHCLGGVGMTFAFNGSFIVDRRGLSSPSHAGDSIVREM